MEIKINTRYANTQYYSCNYALVLDKRHKKEGKDTYPLAMRFTIDRKHFYYNVEGEYTEEQFSLICSLSKKAVRSDLYEKKKFLILYLRSTRQWWSILVLALHSTRFALLVLE